MFLDYLSLVLLIAIAVLLFYGVIAIHDIPHNIAKARNHPHQDAIGAAAWVSLFMMGSLWPLLWIWAMAYRPERGWGFAEGPVELAGLRQRVGKLEEALKIKEGP